MMKRDAPLPGPGIRSIVPSQPSVAIRDRVEESGSQQTKTVWRPMDPRANGTGGILEPRVEVLAGVSSDNSATHPDASTDVFWLKDARGSAGSDTYIEVTVGGLSAADDGFLVATISEARLVSRDTKPNHDPLKVELVYTGTQPPGSRSISDSGFSVVKGSGRYYVAVSRGTRQLWDIEDFSVKNGDTPNSFDEDEPILTHSLTMLKKPSRWVYKTVAEDAPPPPPPFVLFMHRITFHLGFGLTRAGGAAFDGNRNGGLLPVQLVSGSIS